MIRYIPDRKWLVIWDDDGSQIEEFAKSLRYVSFSLTTDTNNTVPPPPLPTIPTPAPVAPIPPSIPPPIIVPPVLPAPAVTPSPSTRPTVRPPSTRPTVRPEAIIDPPQDWAETQGVGTRTLPYNPEIWNQEEDEDNDEDILSDLDQLR